jgi:hypothetical protein
MIAQTSTPVQDALTTEYRLTIRVTRRDVPEMVAIRHFLKALGRQHQIIVTGIEPIRSEGGAQ